MGYQSDSDSDSPPPKTSLSYGHSYSRGGLYSSSSSTTLPPPPIPTNLSKYLKSPRRDRASTLQGDPSEFRDEGVEKKEVRKEYWDEVATPSLESPTPVKPKSRLLVSDLDNTLFGPSGDGIVSRPYLKTFLRYIMHPSTPYSLAIWTFSGRRWGQAHLRQAGVGELLFEGEDKVVDKPRLRDGFEVLWGYEDSGFLPCPPDRYGTMASGPAVKDLELIWELLNIQGGEDWSPFNSFLVDDQISNGRLEPDSIMVCPLFTDNSPDDDFLLAFIGVLDELAPSSIFAAMIKKRNFREGIAFEHLDYYVERGKKVCFNFGIKVSRGTPYHDPAFVEDVEKSTTKKTAVVPVHDAAPEPAEPDPGAFKYGRPVPKRVAKGMPLSPSADYLAQVKKVSRVGKVGKPLVVFDLDGTLYHRPPQNLEHDPSGEPTGRPYLRSFLEWVLRPSSPWTVAIWTGSQKKTATRCLYELDLGIVGPELLENGQAEILHPKIQAVWAREDFGLTPEDYKSYVAVVKDLNRLWKYLRQIGAGDFDASNTVIVDDTPSKLRAQPSSLIAAPTFDYPEDPSDETTKLQLDTFLLSLVSILDELAPETNFVNYIESQGWNKLNQDDEREKDKLKKYEREGVSLLRAKKIAIDAEGRGILPSTIISRNDPGYRTRKSQTSSLFTNSISNQPVSNTSMSSRGLTLDALSKVPNGASPYHSDTSGSDTSESVDGDADDAEERSNSVARSLAHRSRRY
ncbi:hypothetical protein JCM16303_000088 [Sporobolomyces ruberrimus]